MQSRIVSLNQVDRVIFRPISDLFTAANPERYPIEGKSLILRSCSDTLTDANPECAFKGGV